MSRPAKRPEQAAHLNTEEFCISRGRHGLERQRLAAEPIADRWRFRASGAGQIDFCAPLLGDRQRNAVLQRAHIGNPKPKNVRRPLTACLGAPNIYGMDTNKLINELGGTAEVARICGVKQPSVSDWRKYGIPKARLMYLQLLRPDVFSGRRERVAA